MRVVKVLVMVLLVVSAAMPLWADAPGSVPSKSLYDRMGGAKVLKAVIDEFYDQVQRDSEMRYLFIGQDLGHVKKQTLNYVGQAIGGPQVYEGRDVHASHKRMHIT